MRVDELSAVAGSSAQQVDWQRVVNIAGLVGLVVIVMPFVVFAVPQAVGAQQSYVVLSGSMQPAMDPGDVILVEAVDPETIQRGDVVTFTNGDEAAPTTHRVVEVVDQAGEPAFRTKGDANEDADHALVPASRVEGRVMTVGNELVVLPAIGYVIEYAGTEIGFALLVALPLALFAASEIRSIVRSTRGPTGGRQARATGAQRTTAGDTPDAPVASEPGRVEPASSASTAERDEVLVTLAANELRLALVVIVPFAAYSVWVAAGDPSGVTVGVAVAVCVGTLLLGSLYGFGGSTVEEADGGQSTGTGATSNVVPADREPGNSDRGRRPSAGRPAGRLDGGGAGD